MPADKELVDAAMDGLVDLMKNILQRPSVDVNYRDNDDHGRTAMHWAALHDDTQVLDILLNNNAEVNPRDNEGNTSLILAVTADGTGVAQTLLSLTNVEVNAKNNYGRTPLMEAAGKSGDYEMVKQLLKHQRTEINLQDNEGSTSLILAIYPHNE